jgi:putative phosphoribosyl transferase
MRARPKARSAATIEADGVRLAADLAVPEAARGVAIFAHGSGSSRHSPRNQMVASRLEEDGFATILADLLTEDEEAEDSISGALRFDIPLLAGRVMALVDWAAGSRQLPIGLFGASTGAAAALVAAARRTGTVGAVVSRGGRPDLAGEALHEVHAPTLLVVGGDDSPVLELNERAATVLPGPHRVDVIPGATHLFEEPGALEEVSHRAAAWFDAYLS